MKNECPGQSLDINPEAETQITHTPNRPPVLNVREQEQASRP